MATVKQKLAFKKVVKGSTITKAMKDVNYSPSTAARTNKLTGSKGWKELAEKYISEAKLAKVHAEGLNATKKMSATVFYNEEGEESKEMIEVPDYSTRHKYLVTGYEVRGMLKEDVGQRNVNILIVTSEGMQRYGVKEGENVPTGVKSDFLESKE